MITSVQSVQVHAHFNLCPVVAVFWSTSLKVSVYIVLSVRHICIFYCSFLHRPTVQINDDDDEGE